jgi:DNA-binding CsgD family transcriptional regulator
MIGSPTRRDSIRNDRCFKSSEVRTLETRSNPCEGKDTSDVDGATLTPAGLTASTFTVEADEYVIFEFPLAAPEPPQGLSDAEREVARELLAGRTAAEIAKRRERSLSTVRNQVRAIYAKLGVGSAVEFTAYCSRCR